MTGKIKTISKTGVLIFGLTLVNTEVKVETEVLVYPFTSFVSEFGGALGLFLGFSFFMLWDWIIKLVHLFKASKNAK